MFYVFPQRHRMSRAMQMLSIECYEFINCDSMPFEYVLINVRAMLESALRCLGEHSEFDFVVEFVRKLKRFSRLCNSTWLWHVFFRLHSFSIRFRRNLCRGAKNMISVSSFALAFTSKLKTSPNRCECKSKIATFEFCIRFSRCSDRNAPPLVFTPCIMDMCD